MAGTERSDTWAVVVYRQDGIWEVGELPPAITGDLRAVVAAVSQQEGGGGPFALVDIADEFFVVVRLVAGQVRLLLSDVTAAVAWDLAAQVCEALDLDVPADDDLDEVWPAGDLGIFDDLGVDEMELGAILSDVELYADEMLSALARRLGFADAFERVIDVLV
ncbi:MAG: tRNA adenosine deaminase-associated protein [Nocardioidaceae bacterium]